MTSTLDSLLTIPPFAPTGLEPRRRRQRLPGMALFRTQVRAATLGDLPIWPVIFFAWMAALVTFFISLR